MNVYSIDLKIYATAYIRAESTEQAQAIAAGLSTLTLELDSQYLEDDACISGADYRNLEYEVSLSPAMTSHGVDEGALVDLVEEDVDADDE